MKKTKLLILGLITLMLAGGLAVASCKGTPCEGVCEKDTAKCATECYGKGDAGLSAKSCQNACD